jgi:hypothetical protein
VTNLASGTTVWTNEVSEVGTAGQRDVPAVVAEMNATMGRAIEKLHACTRRRWHTEKLAVRTITSLDY